MTAVELVERERRRLRAAHAVAGGMLVVAAGLLGLAIGALALGGARWIALPRGTPFAVWAVVGVAGLALAVWMVRRGRAGSARSAVASAIERERALRTGALRGAIEVANAGALGRLAAQRVAAQLGARR
ncbi:MAG TPA: hypothetical protein VNA89_02860, partial [Gemmatimonadaceae bacterium]|nr:hypothetical protein [Gemmatimonadaceae bacterium]